MTGLSTPSNFQANRHVWQVFPKARAPLAVVRFLGLITLVIERAELKIIQKGTCRTSRGDKRMWRVLSSRLIRWRLLARTSVVLVLGSGLDCLSTATTSVIVQL
jgi:hypothetical protein